MNQILSWLHHSPLLSHLFPTQVACLKAELKNCHSVLDIGCGPSSPIQYCGPFDYTVGVEPFKPYLLQSKSKHLHHRYYAKNILQLNFPENCFDAVIFIDVLEHMSREDGNKLINLSKIWAKKKVIFTTPNGFVYQKILDNNPLQIHKSGWEVAAINKLDFKVKGLAGLKLLRQHDQKNTMNNGLLSSIRYQPKILWFIIATLSQALTYHFPAFAFELFCVHHKSTALVATRPA